MNTDEIVAAKIATRRELCDVAFNRVRAHFFLGRRRRIMQNEATVKEPQLRERLDILNRLLDNVTIGRRGIRSHSRLGTARGPRRSRREPVLIPISDATLYDLSEQQRNLMDRFRPRRS